MYICMFVKNFLAPIQVRLSPTLVIPRDAPIIGIGRLSSVLPIIGIGRLVCWYQPIVVYTIGKYRFLLHDVSVVKIVVFIKGMGHFERTFQGEWGIAHQWH